ncbi:N-acetyltransferase NAT13 [Rhizopogon vinicolor AM-OR11-026]|uniref:N-acetyltransferase NAT13 n=1 Tax=Rhizopogon vinicolor AM-OR11-026 TaxID=1314800 RepID=A0A1B7N8B5_9AGAM|nr:N-acetyltransferase NAT13 [Rhizopogon vinicolor AM-OR11-026]
MSNSPAASSSSRITFAYLTYRNIGTVRKLNSVLFPIKYSDKFYQDILATEVEDFCQLVYYNDVPVGIICCRLENKDLYLMTMGVLAPYRSRQLGSETLKRIIKAAASHSKPKIRRIYLHVQTSNTEAKNFYEKNGFKEVGIKEDYYKKIVPRDAWILERVIDSEGKQDQEQPQA